VSAKSTQICRTPARTRMPSPNRPPQKAAVEHPPWNRAYRKDGPKAIEASNPRTHHQRTPLNRDRSSASPSPRRKTPVTRAPSARRWRLGFRWLASRSSGFTGNGPARPLIYGEIGLDSPAPAATAASLSQRPGLRSGTRPLPPRRSVRILAVCHVLMPWLPPSHAPRAP